MTELDRLLAERSRSWLEHPIITESAVLPTRPVKDAVVRVKRMARKARGSIAWWADPLTGKSFCIRAIKKMIEMDFPGAGIVHLEAVEDQKQQAEGRLLITILRAIGLTFKVAQDLADKREQVRRALIAHAGSANRIFIIIDEAQELSNGEFAWLKAVINGVCEAGIKVTTVLFGQRELQKRQRDLKANGRSDLSDRFLKKLMEFKGLRRERDLAVMFDAIDHSSEYPQGSRWTYTRFLLPEAYDGGFRLGSTVNACWQKVTEIVPSSMLKKGLPMHVAAAFVANLFETYKGRDCPGLSFDENDIEKAFVAALEEN